MNYLSILQPTTLTLEDVVSLPNTICFDNSQTEVTSQGRKVCDESQFAAYLANRVSGRLFDDEQKAIMHADIQGLVSADMDPATIEEFLFKEVDREAWEIGEALAETLLEDESGVVWPWNSERDKRTPKASLPGADLVGFITTADGYELAFGEVKTSTDMDAPPGVMTGRSGMIQQLENLVNEQSLRKQLIAWLHPRCKGSPFENIWQEAVSTYLRSRNKKYTVIGMLMRDTPENPMDLKNRAIALSVSVKKPTTVILNAWYFPQSSEKWIEGILSVSAP